jgi:hypothetical protein
VLEIDAPAIHLDAPQLAEGIGLTGTLQTERLEVSIGDTVGVSGKVQIDSDDVEILGRRYLVESTSDGPSGLAFNGTIDPRVALAMSYQFPELTLHVDVSGRLSKLDPPRFSSDPPGLYTQDQLFGFFLGGEPNTDPGSPARDPAREAATGAVAGWLTGKLRGQLNKVLPGELKLDFSCDPDPTAPAGVGACAAGEFVRVPFLKQPVHVAVRRRIQPRPDENVNEAQLQFRLPFKLLFQASGGERGYLDGDLLWRHRW